MLCLSWCVAALLCLHLILHRIRRQQWREITGLARGNLRMARILVVDDETTTCRTIARLLRTEGHDACCATGGAKALEQLGTQQKPDLVVLDLMMPPPDGLDVLDAIRHDRRLLDVPVVIYTASSDPQTRHRALQMGASDYVNKGLGWAALYEQIAKLLPN
jgi:CheY-like chemotaxis protein